MAKYNKLIVALLGLLGAVAALVFTGYDPSFTTACISLVGPVFGVIGVFAAKNHTIDDLSKSVAALQAAALTVVSYFTVIPESTVARIAVLVGAGLSVIGVYWVPNAGSAQARVSISGTSKETSGLQ